MVEGRLSGTNLQLVLTLLCCLRHQATGSDPVIYNLTVDVEEPLYSVDRRFLGVTLDTYSHARRWHLIKFQSQRFLNQAAALAPCELRFGGTMADYLTFDPTATFDFITQTADITLSRTQWDHLTAFLEKVGWDLTFDFNLFKRRKGMWDPTNAEQLLNYSASKNIHISGFELGNEVDRYLRNKIIDIQPSDLVRDFGILRNLISRYSLYNSSLLYGPGITAPRWNSPARVYLNKFVAAGGADVVDEIAIHHYYMAAKNRNLSHFLDIITLDSLKDVLKNAFNILKTASRPAQLRLSETASFSGGGIHGLSDAYVAGFMWLDKLGVSATSGLSRVLRQSLLGAAYTLLVPQTYFPNPDYFLSLLYKRLIEGHVFPVTVTPKNRKLRVYANCARRDYFPPGSVVLYFLNVGDQDLILSVPQFTSLARDVFLLTPGDNRGLKSKYVKVNGKIMQMSGNDVPQMSPERQSGDVRVGAQNFGFIVLPEAEVAKCGFSVRASSSTDNHSSASSCCIFYHFFSLQFFFYWCLMQGEIISMISL